MGSPADGGIDTATLVRTVSVRPFQGELLGTSLVYLVGILGFVSVFSFLLVSSGATVLCYWCAIFSIVGSFTIVNNRRSYYSLIISFFRGPRSFRQHVQVRIAYQLVHGRST